MTDAAGPGRKTAVIAANSAWNIRNFRMPLIAALQQAGWRVAVLAPGDGAGVAGDPETEMVPIRVDSSGTSPVRDTRLFLDYLRALRTLQPDVFLGFTVKPNIYGSLAAALLGIRVINNISGLGTAFMQPGPLNWFVRQLYRPALRKSAIVFFQNPHDRDLFIAERLVRREQARLVPGSGIDLAQFSPRPGLTREEGEFRFLFVGRLLRDKGLVEYAEAARMVKGNWPEAEFAILGFAGSANPSAVPISEVERWQAEGLVTYLGATDDVRQAIGEADCVVLPSYREGLPRSLAEAAAMAKPMIATDVPGCRDVVTDGAEGFLCRPRSAEALAEAMEKMLKLRPTEREEMGRRARQKAEQQFSEDRVVAAYMEALG